MSLEPFHLHARAEVTEPIQPATKQLEPSLKSQVSGQVTQVGGEHKDLFKGSLLVRFFSFPCVKSLCSPMQKLWA